MKSVSARICSNVHLTEDILRMELETQIASEVACGQFVQVQVPGFFLRRPISVSEVTAENRLVLIYRTVGGGTEALAGMREGEVLDVFGPLGNGFPLLESDVVLVGGGVGIPPLAETAKRYVKNGHHVTAVLGYASKEQMFALEAFEKAGAQVIVATMDGSAGTKGTVMDAIREHHVSADLPVLACGPKGMLGAVCGYFRHGCISMEERMACGIGACMGCVVRTPEGGSLRVCKDGPVFEIGKVVL